MRIAIVGSRPEDNEPRAPCCICDREAYERDWCDSCRQPLCYVHRGAHRSDLSGACSGQPPPPRRDRLTHDERG